MAGDATPDLIRRENLAAALASHTRALSQSKIRSLVDWACAPDTVLNSADIARIAEVSRPTAAKYRRIILAAIERGPEALTFEADPQPSAELLDRANAAANKLGQERTSETNKARRGKLTSRETSAIIDRHIMRLDKDFENTSPAALQQLIKLKIDFENLSASQDEEVDLQKTLGPGALNQLQPRMIERFELLMHHRHELPTFYAAAGAALLRAAALDVVENRLPADIARALQLLLATSEGGLDPSKLFANSDESEAGPDLDDPVLRAADEAHLAEIAAQIENYEPSEVANSDDSDDVVAPYSDEHTDFDPLARPRRSKKAAAADSDSPTSEKEASPRGEETAKDD